MVVHLDIRRGRAVRWSGDSSNVDYSEPHAHAMVLQDGEAEVYNAMSPEQQEVWHIEWLRTHCPWCYREAVEGQHSTSRPKKSAALY